jgi:hypothetical protein
MIMSTTNDYRTGKIVEGIRKAEAVLDNIAALTDGDPAVKHIREKILAFRPVWITSQEAMEMIRESAIVAVGKRVCRALHPESPETQSVFLDELARAMSDAGKAEIVPLDEAFQVIESQPGNKFIASMVSGRYLELCAVHPPDCIFCKAEQAGIRCFERHRDSSI